MFSRPPAHDGPLRLVGLTCLECCTPVPRASELVLAYEGASSWAGHIMGRCFACSGITLNKDFKKASKRAWESYSIMTNDKAKRARNATWETMKAEAKALDPTLPSHQVRLKALERIKAFAVRIAISIAQGPPAFIAASKAVHEDYLRSVDRSARDCTIPGSADGWTLVNTDCAYLTNIATGVTISFMCRNPKCLFYGMNDQWVKHVTQEQFRCPRCAKLYEPWTQKNGEFPAQKVFGCPDPKTGLTMVIPCKWPDSHEDGWLNKEAEAYARDIQTPTD